MKNDKIIDLYPAEDVPSLCLSMQNQVDNFMNQLEEAIYGNSDPRTTILMSDLRLYRKRFSKYIDELTNHIIIRSNSHDR